MRIVALLTDFGNEDSYVGVMKGVLCRYAGNVRFIDLTHEVRAFSVLSAAYLLYAAWDWFPEGTVFLSVVDPGVGSSRRELLATIDGKTSSVFTSGFIMHRDRFGNCITSIHHRDIAPYFGKDGFASIVFDTKKSTGREQSTVSGVRSGRLPSDTSAGPTQILLKKSFSDVGPNEPLCYWGSSGFLEIALREGKAAEHFGLDIGNEVTGEFRR